MAPSLLFIPDISGFTKFVNRTAVEHGRHIIAELLDLIIESDELGLTVSELEGDAVFFYREGPLPSFDEIAAQARRTFEAFHRHLRAYEVGRICSCGACSSAHELSLKIVVHAGPVELLAVRDFRKPYGSDVIVAHRLLKNGLDESEYLLVTDAALEAMGSERPATPWAGVRSGSTPLDDLGSVSFHWIPLAPLRAGIPAPELIRPLERSTRPVAHDIYIDRPPSEVFDLILDLDRRLTWNRGVDRLEYEHERVNRVGTRHRCVIDGRLIDFETVTNDFGPDRLVYGERVENNPFVDEHVNYFIVEPEGSGSRVCFEAHLRPRPFPRSLLAPLVRLRLGRLVPTLLGSLKQAAEQMEPPDGPQYGSPSETNTLVASSLVAAPIRTR